MTTEDGKEQEGRLVSFTPAGVQLKLPNGTVVAVPMNTIQRVDVRDGLGNGARNGAIAGGLIGLLSVIAFKSDCGHECDDGYVAFAVTALLAYTAMGAGVGAGIDALIHGRETIYSSKAPRQVAVAPLITPHGAGVRVGVRW